jgi:hypothetical protein
VSTPAEYLRIPEEYVRRLGGMRWADDWQAIEHSADEPHVGLTFAMGGEIARFLDGFQAAGRPIHFVYILHLLHLLGVGTRGREPALGRPVDRLAQAFRDTCRPLRTAGALCATLCRDVPRVADPPDLAEVCDLLDFGTVPTDDPDRTLGPPELPSLEPDEFEARVFRAMARLSDSDLHHWLRHGRGPLDDAGERLAPEVGAARPKTLVETLAALERRPRLAGAAPLVAHLAGALALPARRLDPATLPAGGYSDVATRGQPEQILPAQFGLDDLEFLRRFAERQLLYYHREDPRTPAEEELAILVDQGVRTWGDIRLVLAAATLALCRQAARRGIPLLLATTGTEGRFQMASELDEGALGDLLEASDLSPHPGPALERALEDHAERPRDIVLMTHPRALMEPGLAATTRRVMPGTRLFAVAVDGEGEVILAELRHGSPVALGRCRVAIPEAVADEPRPAPASASTEGPWRGDVEPIGFPFALGAVHPIADEKYEFDHAGQWLLAAVGPLGLLHAWKVDGTVAEMLPRPMVGGSPLTRIEAVVGVAGGFVVAGRDGDDLIAAHYDFPGRSCRVHVLGPAAGRGKWGCPPPHAWSYLPDLHSVATFSLWETDRVFAVDLGAEPCEACCRSESPDAHASRRARLALLRARISRATRLLIIPAGNPLPAHVQGIRLDPATGQAEARTSVATWSPFIPLTDGQPILKGAKVLDARSGRGTLALLVQEGSGRRAVHLFLAPSGHALGSYPVGPDVASFALARDGKRFAHRVGRYRLAVRDVGGGAVPRLMPSRGRAHPRLDVDLGPGFLIARAGRFTHVIRWSGGTLAIESTEDVRKGFGLIRDLPGAVGAVTVPGGLSYDGRRFVAKCTAYGLTALIDALGEVALLDAEGSLIAMVYAFRSRLEVWLPDGTRLGRAGLGSSPGDKAAPGAAERVAAALNAASARRRIATR